MPRRSPNWRGRAGRRRWSSASCTRGFEPCGPADEIDPAYGDALRRAAAAGVTVLALRCDVSLRGIVPADLLPVNLG